MDRRKRDVSGLDGKCQKNGCEKWKLGMKK